MKTRHTSHDPLWAIARMAADASWKIHLARRVWLRWMFQLDAMGTLGSFVHGKGLLLEVPVRVGRSRGRLEIGDGVGLGYLPAPRFGNGQITLEPRDANAVIVIGSECHFSNNVQIVSMSSIRIGRYCRIGDASQIFDCDFHQLDPAHRHVGTGLIESVTIGDNVWLGSRVMILRGVNIGDNSVIGAGSVVTHSIPANSVAVGVPAKVIRNL